MRLDAGNIRGWLAPRRIPILVGLVAGVLSLHLLQQERAAWKAAAGAGVKQTVLVLNRSVKAGTPLESRWFDTIHVPVAYVHPLSTGPDDGEVLRGLRAERDLRAGQPLLWSDVASPVSGDSEMAGLVRPDERAISLRINEVSGVGRLIRNNDHIDIFGTFQRPEGVVTIPILQNVVVVATGRTLHGSGGSDYNTISVSVTPQEAALLTLAQETGRLTYVLRNSLDFETVPELQRVSMNDLFEDGRRRQMQEQHNQKIRVLKGKF